MNNRKRKEENEEERKVPWHLKLDFSLNAIYLFFLSSFCYNSQTVGFNPLSCFDNIHIRLSLKGIFLLDECNSSLVMCLCHFFPLLSSSFSNTAIAVSIRTLLILSLLSLFSTFPTLKIRCPASLASLAPIRRVPWHGSWFHVLQRRVNERAEKERAQH